MRLTARQACPALKKRPIAAAAVARRTSASSATIIGSLPPSSSVTRVTFFAASCMIRLPVSVWPVEAVLGPLGGPGEVLEVLGDPGGLDLRVREGLALLLRQELRDLVDHLVHLPGGLVHELGALRSAHGGPPRG